MVDKPISNREAEQGVLAAVIRNPAQYKPLADILQPDSFSWECFSWCWEAFAKLEERGLRLDAITLGDELDRAGRLARFQLPELKQFTGRAALSQLRDIETTDAATSYAINVQDYAAKRKIDEWLTQAHNHVHNGRSAGAIMADLQTSFGTLSLHSGKISTHTVNSEQAGVRALALSQSSGRGERAVATGIPDLDRLLYPQRGELITVAAQTGKGKSSLLATIALNSARDGKSVKMFVLEMSSAQIAQRILSQISEISASKIMQGHLTEDEWEKYQEAISEFALLPITICDLSAIKIGQVRTEARRSPADIIMLDYIQLANADKPQQNRVLDVGEVTRGLKALAMELDVPVFAAAQVSRATDARGDKKPVLSDLRESGSIEQDSDSVCFIWNDPIKTSTWELQVAKHRNGACGKIELYFHAETTRFSGLAQEPEIRDYSSD